MLTPLILSKMTPDELSKVKVVTRKNGAKRCESVGIHSVKLKFVENELYQLEWSDENGDPQVRVSLNENLKNIYEGNYSYTLTLVE